MRAKLSVSLQQLETTVAFPARSRMAHVQFAHSEDKLTLALRIPRVGAKASFSWDGVKLCVAAYIRNKVYCVHIETVRRRESEICELAITFLTKTEEIIDAVCRNQFPNVISGVETLRERGILHQTITDVTTVWCSTGMPATIIKEDPARWHWIDDLPLPMEWRRDREMNMPNDN